MRFELTCRGLAWYPTYGLGMWTTWKGTSYTDWECGWFGKMPGVRIRLWSVPSVRIGNVDGLERYLVYGLGMWMVWKGAWSTTWVVVGTQRAEWDCGWLGKVPRVWIGIVYGLERCSEYDFVDDC
jgi:hypothetical protein